MASSSTINPRDLCGSKICPGTTLPTLRAQKFTSLQRCRRCPAMMEQKSNPGQWFKLADAAQELGVSEITVRRKVKAGQLKAILRNGRYIVFLEENTELGMYTAALDAPVTPSHRPVRTSPTLPTLGCQNFQNQQNALVKRPDADEQSEVIQSLKRTIADQQTLISSLEASISRLHQKLAHR